MQYHEWLKLPYTTRLELAAEHSIPHNVGGVEVVDNTVTKDGFEMDHILNIPLPKAETPIAGGTVEHSLTDEDRDSDPLDTRNQSKNILEDTSDKTKHIEIPAPSTIQSKDDTSKSKKTK